MSIADRICPPGTIQRRFVADVVRTPLCAPLSFLRSVWASYKLTHKLLPLAVYVAPHARLILIRAPSARVAIQGFVTVQPCGGLRAPASISLGKGSVLDIRGAFYIGPKVHIDVGPGATLSIIGGSGSGVTSDARIIVKDRIDIGANALIAFDVTILDSDLHTFCNRVRTEKVVIGNDVWIAHGASILAGSVIPCGCVVAAKSIVMGKFQTMNALLAGAPATMKRLGITWKR